ILNYWDTFHYWWVFTIAGLGGVLGVMFTIPLRRSLIVEQKLAFPEGTATAEVLRVGESGARGGARSLFVAALVGGLVKLAETGLKLWGETAAAATFVGTRTIAYIGTNLSPALLSVGYIVGLNIAVLVFAGGAISWYFAIPIYSTFFLDQNPQLAQLAASGASAAHLADAIWSAEIRYLGVGAMLVGGIWALISMRSSLLAGVKSGLAQYGHLAAGGHVPETDRDIPMKWVFTMIVLLVVPIFFLYQNITGQVSVSVTMTLVMVITGFLFSSVAGYMAGLVGSSNNPISGVTIATILFTALMLAWLMGPQAATGPAAAIMVGGVVAAAAAIAGDNLQDLKAGHLVGATPWKLQIMQSIGVISGVLVMAPILNLLVHAYGIGTPTAQHPNPLTAPQATLMASVAQGVFHGGLPWTMVAIGAVVGVAIIIVDEILKARGSSWRAPVLAVAVGIYLPLELSVPILVGGLVNAFAQRFILRRDANADVEGRMRGGMLFAAGLITGEALLGIFLAIPIVVSGKQDVMAIPGLPNWWMHSANTVGVLVVGAVAWWLYRIARGGEPGTV
ncbi:MAG: oligopeptide transporter, OPT family, partial [Gammaproteobacteria bacterium]